MREATWRDVIMSLLKLAAFVAAIGCGYLIAYAFVTAVVKLVA